ncbi:hypothetical protein [Streptomyces sp. NPDC047042]|uniref:hypothetical protein n=1 Tax=Streptomyces sp. NPDC047042 TaxID=3154807 RepID=UPI0033F68126
MTHSVSEAMMSMSALPHTRPAPTVLPWRSLTSLGFPELDRMQEADNEPPPTATTEAPAAAVPE